MLKIVLTCGLFVTGWCVTATAEEGPAQLGEPAVSGGENEHPEESGRGLFEQALAGEIEIGEDGEADAPESDFLSFLPGLDINGHLRAGAFAGREEGRRRAELKSAYSELALKLRLRAKEYGDAFGEFRARAVGDGEDVETELDAREAYLNLYYEPFSLRLGHQIVSWGRADGINPTDNATPRDFRVYSPDEDDRRQANFGMRAYANFLPFRIEMLWMPLFARSHYPPYTAPDSILLADPDFPGSDLAGGTGALRLHLELPGTGLSLSYLRGHASFPTFRLESVESTPAGPITTVAETSYAQHVAGFDFATSVGDLVCVRGEFAFRAPDHAGREEYLPLEDVQYVLGLDRDFGDHWTVITQYVGRHVVDWESIEPADPAVDLPGYLRDSITAYNRILTGQTEEFIHGGSVSVTLKLLQDSLLLETRGLLFSNEEWSVRSKITYHLTDEIVAVLGAEIFRGPTDTLFGLVDDSLSTVFIELKMLF